ncbi:MAG TPA: aminoglycoside phosphotransferase [Thermodesulfobacteriaceae bacterium]|nr:aminoglycoside phosphotransferase [Thermodesulfobacteriaceae bacterium]
MASEPIWMNTLLDPSSYPHRVEEVSLVQTHISWVFIAGDRVYKIKKPVDFGFLDFTTLEKRRHFCSEELRLNRRLCPEIYLDVWPVTSDNGKIAINGTGRTVEWCVVMKRMPEDGMMARLIRRDLIGRNDADMIIDRLVPFYRASPRKKEVDQMGSLEIIRQNTEENFDQTVSFTDRIMEKSFFDRISQYTRSFIRDKETLFRDRVDQGWIKEGHGDLYSANICFDRADNKVYIFDCIEFNRRFRSGDVASDVAFLAMDLDFHGLPVLSRYFIDSFSSRMDDPDLPALMEFYKCYRAYVRGKIGCFTWASDGLAPEIKADAGKQAREYFRLAMNYAGGFRKRPVLYCFFGLSGTGKTTIASAWAERHHLAIYNSDRVRKELVAGISAEEHRLEPFGHGLYGAEQTERTYRALARFAGRHLMQGESVVLDATYTDQSKRKRLVELAECAGADLRFILATCPEDEIKKRLEHRIKQENQVSDGRWEIYLKQKEVFAPVSHTGQALIELSTERPVPEILERLDSLLGKHE